MRRVAQRVLGGPVLSGTLLLSTEDRPVTITELGNEGMKAFVEGHHARHEGNVRVRLISAGKDVTLLARVLKERRTTSRQFGPRTHLRLGYEAIWCPDADVLRRFLSVRLRVESTSLMDAREQTWFYRFQGSRGDLQITDTRRRDPRIPVRMPLAWRAASGLVPGVAYNISVRGLFILSDTAAPDRGTEVEVVLPLSGAPSGRATLKGVVCWTGGPGFGLELTTIDDARGGEIWRTLVDEEARLGGRA